MIESFANKVQQPTFTKLGLMRLCHLNERRIFLVEQDLHPVDITHNSISNTCDIRVKTKNHPQTHHFIISCASSGRIPEIYINESTTRKKT